MPLTCLQNLGWAVWPFSVFEWRAQVEDAAGAAGLPEDYDAASELLAARLAAMVWANAADTGTGSSHGGTASEELADGLADTMDAGMMQRVDRMVQDLGDYVASCMAAALTVADRQQPRGAEGEGRALGAERSSG
jgi:hypothetical protein